METTEVSGANVQNDGVTSEAKEVNDYKKDMLRFKDEKRAAEEKALKLEQELESLRLAEEEKKGNLSSVLEQYKEKTRTLETQLKQKDYVYAKSRINDLIKLEAKNNGCKDAEAFLQLVGKPALDSISFDENYNPDMQDVKLVVEQAIKKYEHIGLFSKSVNIVDGVPNNTPVNEEKKFDINKMTWQEAKELARTLK